jgi:hypothetical protein
MGHLRAAESPNDVVEDDYKDKNADFRGTERVISRNRAESADRRGSGRHSMDGEQRSLLEK